jgi:hypothetical protein
MKKVAVDVKSAEAQNVDKMEEPSIESAINYAKEAIKYCEEKILIEGVNGKHPWEVLKTAWEAELDKLNKL